jgi:hypothetical protein
MAALRSLADEHSGYRAHGTDFPVESYFMLSTGEFMLCRTDSAPKDTCGGEWWQFRKEGNSWQITGHNAWICVD